MTDTLFITKIADTLGEDFMLSDLLGQEELFNKQDTLARIIADAANSDNRLAKIFVRKWPRCFNTAYQSSMNTTSPANNDIWNK